MRESNREREGKKKSRRRMLGEDYRKSKKEIKTRKNIQEVRINNTMME